MTREQRDTLDTMAGYAERFVQMYTEKGDTHGAAWHAHRAGADALRAALVERTCGTCRHYDPNHGTLDGVPYGFCESPVSWFRSHGTRPMPPHEGCTNWAARDEDDGA
jgi:hypothetical protein